MEMMDGYGSQMKQDTHKSKIRDAASGHLQQMLAPKLQQKMIRNNVWDCKDYTQREIQTKWNQLHIIR